MSIDEKSNEFNDPERPSKRRQVRSRKRVKREQAPAKSCEKSSQPYTREVARKKARKAYDNAKYRCGKQENYQDIKFLIPSFGAMIDKIGLPRVDDTLDRIDPIGHYELNNIRWANSHVQAANKRGARGASLPSLQQLVETARASQAGLERRTLTARLWDVCVARLVGAAASANRPKLASEVGAEPIPTDSFDAYDIPRRDLPPGVFHLPALTCPESWVRVVGGPFPPFIAANEGHMHARERRQRWAQRGIVGSFDREEFRANFLPHELAQLMDDLKGSGACWLGYPSRQALLSGWFEGKMIATTGRLTALNKSAAVLPACRAVEEFEDYQANQYECHVVSVHAEFLFIPDFQVDQGPGWTTERHSLFTLMRLLHLRREAGRKTFFGVQSHRKLPTTVQDNLLGQYRVREFEAQDQISHPSAKEIRASALAFCKQQTGRNFFPRHYDLN